MEKSSSSFKLAFIIALLVVMSFSFESEVEARGVSKIECNSDHDCDSDCHCVGPCQCVGPPLLHLCVCGNRPGPAEPDHQPLAKTFTGVFGEEAEEVLPH
ncbi:hypothetical protein CJ030_MR1G010327 [Morella rubra]|uniref:Uncharacterized protein n=1 Tax=Morella rubra TaxID=262757 RepID=A0A6A1WIM1_9ROSI|nr:hypothetical protein CJ030_MR1G010327 [Morella rubra]